MTNTIDRLITACAIGKGCRALISMTALSGICVWRTNLAIVGELVLGRVPDAFASTVCCTRRTPLLACCSVH